MNEATTELDHFEKAFGREVRDVAETGLLHLRARRDAQAVLN